MSIRHANAAFRLFYSSFVTSTLGDAFRLLAVNVWIFESTDGSPLQRLIVVLLANVPGILLGGVAGVLADRLDRFSVLVTTDVLRIGVGLGLAWCAWAAHPHLALVLVALGNGFGVFFTTSSFALLPQLVDGARLLKVNGLMETTQWVVQVVGPSLAAVTLVYVGVPFAFAVDAGSFALSAMLLWCLRLEAREQIAARESTLALEDGTRLGHWASFKGGVGLIWTTPLIRWLLLASYGSAFVTACTSFSLIFLVADTLDRDPASLGLVYALNGVVAVLAAAAAARLLGASSRLGRVMTIAMVGLTVAQVVMGLAPSVWVLAVGVAISAAANAPYNIAVTTLYMKRVPAEYLGRVEGVDTMADNTVRLLAFAVSLAVVSLANPRAAFLLSAALALPSLVVAATRVAVADHTDVLTVTR